MCAPLLISLNLSFCLEMVVEEDEEGDGEVPEWRLRLVVTDDLVGLLTLLALLLLLLLLLLGRLKVNEDEEAVVGVEPGEEMAEPNPAGVVDPDPDPDPEPDPEPETDDNGNCPLSLSRSLSWPMSSSSKSKS